MRQSESVDSRGRTYGVSTRNLLLMVALVLIIRFVLLGVSIGDRYTFDPDEAWFLSVATSLADDGVFGTDLWADWAGSADQTYWYMPGQMIAAGGALKIFGSSYLVPRFIALIVGAATIGMTYRLGRQLFSRKVGLLSALVLAVDPLFIFTSAYYRPEVWLALLGCGALYLLVWAKSNFDPYLAGLVIAVAVMFHPNGVIYLAGATVFLGYGRRWLDIRSVVIGFIPLLGLYSIYAFSGGENFLDQARWNYFQGSSISGNIAAESSRYTAFVSEHKAHLGILVVWLGGLGFALRARLTGAIPLLVMCAVAVLVFSLVRNKWYVYFSVIAPFLSILSGLFLCQLTNVASRRSSEKVWGVTQVVIMFVLSATFAGYLLVTASAPGFDWGRISHSLDRSIPSGARVLGNPVFDSSLPDTTFVDCLRFPLELVGSDEESISESMQSLELDTVVVDRLCRLSWNSGDPDSRIEAVLEGFILDSEIEDGHYGRGAPVEVWRRSR